MSVLKNIEIGRGPDRHQLERWYEQLLVRVTLKKLFAAGFKVGVQEVYEDSYGDGSTYVPETKFSEELLAVIFNYDQVHLNVVRTGDWKQRQLYFVFGNGTYCLTNYSGSLEDLVKDVYETVKFKLINLDV